jgi:hypothetical protein
VGKFSLVSGDFGDILPTSSERSSEAFLTPDRSVVGLPPSIRHITAVRRKALRAFKNGVPIEAIAFSSSSEDMYKDIQYVNVSYEDRFKYDFNLLMVYRDECLKRPKGSD